MKKLKLKHDYMYLAKGAGVDAPYGYCPRRMKPWWPWSKWMVESIDLHTYEDHNTLMRYSIPRYTEVATNLSYDEVVGLLKLLEVYGLEQMTYVHPKKSVEAVRIASAMQWAKTYGSISQQQNAANRFYAQQQISKQMGTKQ